MMISAASIAALRKHGEVATYEALDLLITSLEESPVRTDPAQQIAALTAIGQINATLAVAAELEGVAEALGEATEQLSSLVEVLEPDLPPLPFWRRALGWWA